MAEDSIIVRTRPGIASVIQVIVALVCLVFPLVAHAAPRDHLLRWIVPPEPDVARYRVYLALAPMSYGGDMDIGFQSPDPNGVASYLLTSLDDATTYYVVMTASDASGNESVFSNEIEIPPAACDPAACGDGNPCTTDGCDQGACVNDPVPDGTSCDDGNPSTVNDTCSLGSCQGVLPDCTLDAQCDDGNVCNGAESCQNFACVAGVPPVCALSSPCLTSACNPASGCELTPVPDGTSCDDGNASTLNDTCSAGSCEGIVPDCTADAQCDDGSVCNGVETCQNFSCVAGVQLTCSSPSPCMDPSCDAVSGCQLTPAPDGTTCDDGNASTLNDTCSAGTCQGEVPECTVDAQCDDGDACNGTETCQSFACVGGVAPTCAPSTQCRDSACNPDSGCELTPVPNGTACDDGDPSTFDDSCSLGACEGAPCTADWQCDDGNMCTADVCDDVLGCVSTNVLDDTACYDQEPGTIGDFCETGACVEMCRLGIDCPAGASRDYLLSWPAPTDPGLLGYRVYISFEPLVATEGFDAGFLLSDPNGMASFLLAGLNARATYYAMVTAYDDAGAEWIVMDEVTIVALPCDPSGCNDGNPCTADGCSGFSCTNDVVPDGTPCDDGSASTIDDLCFSGTCEGVVPECTLDAHCSDGNACSGQETCQDFECVAGTPPTCAPPTQCMNSFCDSTLGCRLVPVPNGTSCNDGNGSTVNDACSAGVCQGIVPQCTANSQCDDGNACDGVETCQAFSCVSGTAPVCLAATQCTNSFCDAASGCGVAPVPDGTSCNDGDQFTGDDVCTAGVCQGVVLECTEVQCEDNDFFCIIQKALLQILGQIDSNVPRPCN